MKFSVKDFSSKCDQIRSKLRISLHLLEKFLMESFIFCAVREIKIHIWLLQFPVEKIVKKLPLCEHLMTSQIRYDAK